MINFSQKLYQERQAEEREARLRNIQKAWDYYEGRHPRVLTRKQGQVDDFTVVNLARPIVDKGVSLLFGKPLSIQIDENGGADTAAETYLKAVLKANRQQLLLHKMGQNGSLAGMAFIKIDPRSSGLPKLIVLDPASVEVRCTPEDIDDVDRYRITYEATNANDEEVQRQQDITRDAGGTSWTITNRESDRRGVYYQVGEPVVWPYPWAPVLHCQNLPAANSVWGYGDLEDAALNDALNLIASTTRKILRLHGHPKTWAKGMTAADLKTWGPDEMWFAPTADAEIQNLEMQSDLASAREFYMTLRAAIYATARIPDLANVGNLGTLTNFGLRVLFADALEKTDTKRVTYGAMIADLCTRLLELGGYGEGVAVTLTWADPLPVDTSAKASEIVIKQSTNLISDETLTMELGYSYQDEQKRRSQQPTTATTATVQVGEVAA